MNSQELIHYGIPGMKWGQRKEYKLKGRVQKLQAKRRELKDTKGVTSSQYRNTAKKLYLERSKYNYQKAKNEGDGVGKTIAKGNIKTAKNVKKYGTAGLDGETLSKVYGNKLTDKEKEAVFLTELEASQRKEKAKRIVSTTLSVIGTVGLAVGMTVLEAKAEKGKGVIRSFYHDGQRIDILYKK